MARRLSEILGSTFEDGAQGHQGVQGRSNQGVQGLSHQG